MSSAKESMRSGNDLHGAAELLHSRLREALRGLGYRELLPVQEKAIPVILRGEHTLIVAPTGSGKTEAALFPVLSMMLEKGVKPGEGVHSVYVTPLRALNRDLEVRIRALAEAVGYSVMVRHGDTPQRLRKEFSARTPDIVITTPESLGLLLVIYGNRIWGSVRWVIVDEVHELVDSKRGVELSLNLEKLSRISRFRVQRIGLSATLSKHSIEEAKLVLAYGRRVEIVQDPTPKRYNIKVDIVEAGDALDLEFWNKAVSRVAEIIREERGSVLVFVNTRYTAELLASHLSKLLGTEVPAHHGSLSRHVREKAERDFREGRIKALVATSSLELGIDIGRVSLVVQFLSPRQVIAMAQRAGRAGHRLYEVSRAVIVTPDNVFEALESGVIAFRAERGHLEDIKAPRNSLDALAHFMAGSVIDGTASSVDDVVKLASGAGPYSSLSRDDAVRVASVLDNVKVIMLGDDGSLRPSRRTRSYFFKVSMIPEERSLKAVDIVSGRTVGELSERFIQLKLLKAVKPKDQPIIILAGKAWKLLEVDIDGGRVTLSPVAEIAGFVPVWEGEMIPVDWRVAREVCGLIGLAMVDVEAARRVLQARKLPDSMVEKIIDTAKRTAEAWGEDLYLSERIAIVESYPGAAILYSCLGSKGNFALATLISKLLEGRAAIEFSYIPYAIVFKTSTSARIGSLVAEALMTAKNLLPPERAGLIYDAVRKSKAYLIRFYHVAKRMGVIDADKSVALDVVKKLADAMRESPIDEETVRELVHDKLDLQALNRYLDSLEDVRVVELKNETPLATEVYGNPYIKRDVSLDLKQIALDILIQFKKKNLAQRRVIMLCTRCSAHFEARVGDIGSATRCPKCGALSLAPLPATEYGYKLLEYYRNSAGKKKLSSEARKAVKEVMDRSLLYLTMASQGLGRKAVEALSATGVGPARAKRVLSALFERGEQGFYEEIIRAEEEYVSTRLYWRDSASEGRRAARDKSGATR